jgi:hypothetical protein
MQISTGSTTFLQAMDSEKKFINNNYTTENGATSLKTTGTAGVNLFFKLCRGIKEGQLRELLDKAWNEDPLDCVKLIFNCRDCRGGKGERFIFQLAMKWLSEKNPEVLLANIEVVPEFGRWDDLLGFIEFGPVFSDRVAEIFATQLKLDLQLMLEGKPCSLASKWAPTEGRKHDRETNASSLIRAKLGCTPRQYRVIYLTPLRNYLRVVEKYMCSKKWSEIDYSKVPSVAMNKLKRAFLKNDTDRFNEWKKALVSGTDPKVKVNSSQVFLHDLVRPYMKGVNEDIVTEKQWDALVENGQSLRDSIVLSDVSGSMSGTPMEVSIALGIFISEMVAEPFKNQVITFETTPRFFHLTKKSLHGRVNQLQSAPWGGSTNFQAVFDLILDKALGYEKGIKVRDSLKSEMMPKRIFVLSDMQFNIASYGNNFMTNYEVIKAKYALSGYKMPLIVFWNLRGDTKDFPVNALENGVTMISGFSQELLRSVVKGKDFTPYGVMRETIDAERYSVLKLA